MSGEEIHRCKRGSRLAQRITFNCGEVTTAVVLPTAKNLLALRPTHPDEISKFLDPNRKLHSGGLQKASPAPKQYASGSCNRRKGPAKVGFPVGHAHFLNSDRVI